MLWKVFQNEIEDITQKIKSKAETKVLFHGTRGTPPLMIYSGEEGFDMRFSNDGMWGRANYFAVNSSYSNGYAFSVPGG